MRRSNKNKPIFKVRDPKDIKNEMTPYKLREFMKTRKLDVYKLAELTGYALSTINLMITGNAAITKRFQNKIEEYGK